ncbi:FCD domain-containing protein [Cytobacillus sp. S13-E01]|uniref:GntR family transcriptional regulator n=1 Tax=Cytobacillus sp. S13-E01 TaxID=3031326 RepID=UPI0023D84CA6|nr:FCD domain-containing protein [Cytobacillus sp. S13-E01]MDF0727095.1 FCD domain-containing protein [Cytobacillus sp. S13-E01]
MAFYATTRATSEDFMAIEQSIEDMELAINVNNMDDYVSANLDFHEKIAKSSYNLVMYNLYQSINNLIEQAQVKAVTVQGVMNESLQFHKDILQAMKQRNAALASELMVKHINSVQGFLQKSQNE